MRMGNSIFLILLISVLLPGDSIPAQNAPRARTLTLNGRDVTRRQDGVEIRIFKEAGGQWTLVGQNEEFKSGDKVKVQFWSNMKGHAYFVNISPSGKQKIVYSSAIEKDLDYTLPSRDGNRDLWIEFDDEKGVEILKLVLTPTPIKLFDEALSRSQGELGESVFSVSQELLGGNQRPEPGSNQRFEQVVRVQPQKTPVSGCPGARGLALRCRSLGLDPPDPKSGKGMVVVAMPDSQNTSGKLNKNEAIIVELRLKHI